MKLTKNTIHIKDVHQELHPTIAEGIKELMESLESLRKENSHLMTLISEIYPWIEGQNLYQETGISLEYSSNEMIKQFLSEKKQ